MRKLLSIAILALLALVALPVNAQQYTFTATTNSAAINATQTNFALASVSGISAASGGNLTDIYIDNELMQVISVNTTAKTVVVIRGASGTQASAHVSGSLVLAAAPPAFQNYDPVGACTVANTPAQPWVNVRTGNQWLCSTKIGMWVPGFGNTVGVNGLSADITGATVTPSGPLAQFTGTTALVTLTTPASMNLKDGVQVTLIFTGSGAGLTWTAAGNIAVAGTSTTAGSSVTFTWNSATSKWSPSRLA